ncbi:MAG: hypothetical protein LBU04_04685, partial [Christensenellaceae bacterium]|nr:hypothetical protein [Christensenellaceae bacterium]
IRLVDWWEHGLTLETFDDNYAKLRVDEIYPEFKDKVKLPLAEVLEKHKNNFFNTDLDADLDISTKTGYNGIDLAFKKFMSSLNDPDFVIKRGNVRKEITTLVRELNKIDKKYECIYTLERETIFEMLADIFFSLGMISLLNAADSLRTW